MFKRITSIYNKELFEFTKGGNVGQKVNTVERVIARKIL